MKLTRRVKRKGELIVVTQSLSFTQAEYDLSQRICDDPHVNLETVMDPNPDVCLAFFRTLWFWMHVQSTAPKETLVRMAERRVAINKWNEHEARSRKIKRVRNKRKSKGAA